MWRGDWDDHAQHESRILRARHQDLEDLVGRIVPRRSEGTPTCLVQIYDGGAMPTSPDHYFYGHPVQLGGEETEGGAWTLTVDAANTYVVDVLHNAPSVGDVLMAYAIGGRWVAERGASNPTYECMCGALPCNLPWVDLTLSWTEGPDGAGSTTLFWTGNSWISDCADDIIWSIDCSDESDVLHATQYTACEDGEFVTSCALAVATRSCSPPMSLAYTIPGTCFLSDLGYEGLTITGPDTIPTWTCCWWCNGTPPSTLNFTHSFYGSTTLSLLVAHPGTGESCVWTGILLWDYPGGDVPGLEGGTVYCPPTTVQISIGVGPGATPGSWELNASYGTIEVDGDDTFAFCPNATHPDGTPISDVISPPGLGVSCIGGRPYSQSWTFPDPSFADAGEVTVTLSEP
jgi:hypothetical protein